MRLFQGFLIFVLIAVAQNTFAVKFVNLGGEYDAFVKASRGKDLAGVEAEWVKFEARHQQIFDLAVYRKQEPGWEDRLRKRRDGFFPEYVALTPKMDELFARAESVVQVQEKRFRDFFPDLANDIPVIFMPSLFGFNGRVIELPEYHRSGLLMGVDFIVKRNDDLNVLFSHEFFHAYQDDHLKSVTVGQTMASPLWTEGFATYVSGLLNPEKNDGELLMDPVLAESCANPGDVAKMAKEYLKVIKTDGKESYGEWFMMAGKVKPVRRGYCVGLKAIREIAKSHPVKDMVGWDEKKFSKETIKILKDLSKVKN